MIHSFKLFDKFIVVDVNSGAVHETDESCFEVINVIDSLLKDRNEFPCDNRIIEALKSVRKTKPGGMGEKYEEAELAERRGKSGRNEADGSGRIGGKNGGTESAEEAYLCECLAEIKELIAQNQLFSKEINIGIQPERGETQRNGTREGTRVKEENRIREENQPQGKNPSPQIKALCLHVSHNCNLKCGYCFAKEGAFGGERSNMTPETGKAAIDFVVKSSGKRKNIEIDFFGGEPLLNFETVKEIIKYARSVEEKNNKHFNFTITTNGILLDGEKLKYINENIDNIVLSIDGRPETNDKMRKKYDGSGCYETVLPKFIETANSRNQDRYYVRGTYTSQNPDFSKDVLHLADMGFRQISIEPVVATDGSGYELKEEHINELYNEYEILAQEYYKRFNTDKWFNFFHFMLDLEQGPCLYKRIKGCGAGNEYVAVVPGGDIFPCHQLAGNKELKMGNVHELALNGAMLNGAALNGAMLKEVTLNEDVVGMFKNCSIFTKEDCKNCWAKFYCSGGCPANAYNFNGNVNKPYKIACDLERKRLECALWIKISQYSH